MIRMTAFVSGMAVTVLELAAARLLAPYFGASLFVWTNVIGVILVGLAIGYVVGGRYADRTKDPRVLYRLLGIAGVFAGVTPFAVGPVSALIVSQGVFTTVGLFALVLGSFVVVTVLFLLPIALLGMTSPFLITIANRGSVDGVGTVSGRIFAWSTVGSILGVFGTGLLFVPVFGTRKTIVGAACALVTLAFVGDRSVRWGAMVMTFLLALVIPAWAAGPLRVSPGLLFERESPYQYVRVNEVGDTRFLIFNEGRGIQSSWRPDTLETGLYYDYFAPLPLLIPERNELRILIVGLGGGTIVRDYASLYPNRSYSIDAVEIDPVVADVAKTYLHMPEENTMIHVADGRMFLQQTQNQYDLIILDAFAQQLYIPWHLTTQEFFGLVRSRLAPGGIVAFNVLQSKETGGLLRSLIATVHTAFPWVVDAPIIDSWNHLIVASVDPVSLEGLMRDGRDPFVATRASYLYETLRPIEATGGMILTDDHAPIELLTDMMFLKSEIL